MKVPVYRSLDKPHSFFTIKGRYMYMMIAGLILSGFLAVVVGIIAGKVLGFVTLGAGAVASYLVTTIQQGKRSDREFFRLLTSKKIKGYIKVRPVRMKDLLKDIDKKEN